MATLTNTKIKDTYDGLLKLGDNLPLTPSRKAVTDGLGNTSGVSINNSGEMRVSDSQIVGDEPNMVFSGGVYSKTLMVGGVNFVAWENNVTHSIISGQQNYISGNNNLVFGANSYLNANSAIMGGNGNFSNNNFTLTIGSNTQNNGNNAIVGGASNDNYGWNSIVSGSSNANYGGTSIMIGSSNTNFGTGSSIFGFRNFNDYGHSYLTAIGKYSIDLTESHIFRVGNGSSGNLRNAIVVFDDTHGTVQLDTLRTSTSYADDSAAASGGVPRGGLYRNGNDVKIRIS